MDIIFNVKDRSISVEGTGRIPSGGLNDVRFKANFEPGYGWESIPNITAVFSRETKWAFEVGVQNNSWYYIPASILARPGIIYVSILGSSSDGVKVLQTITTALIVEPNGLNRNTCVIYPVNTHNEYDTDAYAQYVAAVNEAANRAEIAARILEEHATPLAINAYTKTESDNKYQPKMFLSNTVTETKPFQFKYTTCNSIPSIRTYGTIPHKNATDSKDNPGDFSGTSEITILYSGTSLAPISKTITGFSNLYRASENTADVLDILQNKVLIHRNTQLLRVTDTLYSWIDDNTLRVSLTNQNPIKPTDLTAVHTNIGNVVVAVTTDHIDLSIPKDYDLTDYKILYPLANTYTTTVSLEHAPVITNNNYYINLFNKIGAADPVVVGYFIITVEVDPLLYTDAKTRDLQDKLDALTLRVKALEEA